MKVSHSPVTRAAGREDAAAALAEFRLYPCSHMFDGKRAQRSVCCIEAHLSEVRFAFPDLPVYR